MVFDVNRMDFEFGSTAQSELEKASCQGVEYQLLTGPNVTFIVFLTRSRNQSLSLQVYNKISLIELSFTLPDISWRVCACLCHL